MSEIINNELWSYYYILTFWISLVSLMKIPADMSRIDNFTGSFMAAMFGFALWPFYVLGAYRVYKKRKRGDTHGK